MSAAAQIGEHYARLLEAHLNEAIQKKLDETSSFKKNIAGIHSVQDAKQKGYAPSDAQLDEMKASIRKHARERYVHAHFRTLPGGQAASDIVDAVLKDVEHFNRHWKNSRQFHFDARALSDLATEAAALIAAEHPRVAAQFA